MFKNIPKIDLACRRTLSERCKLNIRCVSRSCAAYQKVGERWNVVQRNEGCSRPRFAKYSNHMGWDLRNKMSRNFHSSVSVNSFAKEIFMGRFSKVSKAILFCING